MVKADLDEALEKGFKDTPAGTLKRLMSSSRIGHALFLFAELEIGCAEFQVVVQHNSKHAHELILPDLIRYSFTHA